MNKFLFQLALVFLPVSGFCQNFSADSVVCDCIEYSDWADSQANTRKFTVSLEELNAVPPQSETRVNYLSDYELEKDSAGRVSKLIRTSQLEGTKEITYFYDSNNRLIQENIHFDNRHSEDKSFFYRDERIDYTYDDFGRRLTKTTKVINGNYDSLIEKCHYIYDSKE